MARREASEEAAQARSNSAALLLAAVIAFVGSAAVPAEGRALHAVLVVMLGAAGVLLTWLAGVEFLAGRRRGPP